MNWALPHQGLQTDFYNQSDTGHRAAYQNLSDYFTNNGGNSFMNNWFNNQYGGLMNRYNTDAIGNPNLMFTDWLQQKAPELHNAFSMLPNSMQGGYSGFSRQSTEKW